MKKSTTKRAQPKPDSAGPFFQPRPGLRGKSWDTNHEPFFSPLIQPKLMVGAANSPAEAEADQMAGQVVQRLEQPETLQRAVMEEEKKEKVQRQPLEEKDKLQKQSAPEEEETVQTKPAANSPAPTSVVHSLQSSKGGGQPLPAALRGGAEQALGADFGSVRVHTNSESARMNEALHAQAFTHGQDVYFNEGKYRPETAEGRRLLGHELGHVVQQIPRIARQETDPAAPATTVAAPGAVPAGGTAPGIVEINIDRDTETATSTTGTMEVGTQSLYTLELPWRANAATGNSATASRIPAGTYNATVRADGPLGWRLELQGTAPRTNIQIHVGNTPADTTGCILPGTSRGTDSVAGSNAARTLIQQEVNNAGPGATIQVTITDPPAPATSTTTPATTTTAPASAAP